MLINSKKLLPIVAITCAALRLHADSSTGTDAGQDFPSAVQFELGDSEFPPGDSITIQSVTGTSDTLQAGNTYCVTGTYTLNSQDGANLSFFATTRNTNPTPIDPAQTVRVTRGTGSFRLVKKMSEDGYPHVTFYSLSNGQGIGGVYFGQGQWVLHNKQYHFPSATPSTADNLPQQPVSSAGANQALYAYLGNPINPPSDLDASYTKDGLTAAIQAAARNAGITLASLEIDDSEFPFLVGVVFTKTGDQEKLKTQIRATPAYSLSGGMGGDDAYAMNIVPHSSFPQGSAEQIYRRMTVREGMLFNKITGSK